MGDGDGDRREAARREPHDRELNLSRIVQHELPGVVMEEPEHGLQGPRARHTDRFVDPRRRITCRSQTPA